MDEYTSVLDQNPYLLVTSDNYKWLKKSFDFWDKNIDFAHNDDEFQAFKLRFEEILAKQLDVIYGYDVEYLNEDVMKMDHDYIKTDHF